MFCTRFVGYSVVRKQKTGSGNMACPGWSFTQENELIDEAFSLC
ncbi:hypothetical protein RSSM_01869 [Rhodopirellula sallentina SM41]|uniref:Uncharacterized protein n=1 Tax=Rhodopirellula sallentina SM41 TaxID=1263870 RepID=M5U5F4_9BACT|nr:hypothetical protein RSSM_01869 [Rhodopirellula sallentina SM41]